METVKTNPMWVIKLGGSLLGSPELKQWLSLVHQHADGNIIVVPGGGVFANAVREADQLANLSAHCSHVLAVKAMDQFAEYLLDVEPRLASARNELEIAERSWQHRGMVWSPSEMVLSASYAVEESWDVTSDSLAAWLATKLGATRLVIVKTADIDQKTSIKTLCHDGVLDQAFMQYQTKAEYETLVLNKSDFTMFENGFV